MSNSIIFSQVTILFLIMAVGFYAKKRNYINEDTSKKLSEILLNITSPFLVISSFHLKFSMDMLFNAGIVFIFSIGIHILTTVGGKLIFRKYTKDIKNVLIFCAVYSNCGFMGFPILEGIYGKAGIFYGSIYVMAFNIFLWTSGVMIFSGKRDAETIKKAFLNPGIISVLIGLIIFIFSVQLPAPVFKAIDMVGSMTVPLSMLIIGAFLADIDMKSMLSGFSVYYGSIVRLIAVPLITLVVLKMIRFPNDLLELCVILVAMPVAATTAIFAEKFEGDAPFASRCVAISTVLSIISIPLIILFMSWF